MNVLEVNGNVQFNHLHLCGENRIVSSGIGQKYKYLHFSLVKTTLPFLSKSKESHVRRICVELGRANEKRVRIEWGQ